MQELRGGSACKHPTDAELEAKLTRFMIWIKYCPADLAQHLLERRKDKLHFHTLALGSVDLQRVEPKYVGDTKGHAVETEGFGQVQYVE